MRSSRARIEKIGIANTHAKIKLINEGIQQTQRASKPLYELEGQGSAQLNSAKDVNVAYNVGGKCMI